MLSWVLKKLVGTKNQREVKRMTPMVGKINEIEATYQSLTDEQLQAKTQEFRDRVAKGETLDALMPEAFAAVKNAARRFSDSKRQISVRGMAMTWEMTHFDVQLIGGMVLHSGRIAEMATGEGKTLVATLPTYLNALSGKGVHVVTVNDYLAARDSEWMGEIYRFLGLTVGCILRDQRPDERRAQYLCDITYGTNSEFGFDYLRDNGMATSKEDQVQRGHNFAIVDEVDSILIDEARVPLIIAGPAQVSSHQYDKFKPLIERLVQAQTLECNRWASEAKALLEKGGDEQVSEAGRLLFKVRSSTPHNSQLAKMLEDGVARRAMEDAELFLYQDLRRVDLYKLKEEALFTLDPKSHEADLSERGRTFLNPVDHEAFILPDITTRFHEIDQTDLPPEEKARQKQEEQQKFDESSERIHNISQLLRAYCLYENGRQYVIENNKVVIVDEFTGRPQYGRRWSDGLHQAVEAKEGVQIERETQTLATITIQNYFRLYDKLAGMTGTAETEANEFHDIYRLAVVVIPTNRPVSREDLDDSIYKTRRAKYGAIVKEVKEAHERGQPVLVGTITVEASELISRMLNREKIAHKVLNARYHQQEAEIVSMAGQRGAVMIATNMAGRGTDIKLGQGVPDVGGLYVIATERHESRRIDRQLRGRCARQGDPGLSKFFISFEDDLMKNFGDNRRIASLMTTLGMKDDEELQHPWLNKSVESAQKRVEQRNYQTRKHTLQYDDVMNQQRAVIYEFRNDVLNTEEPRAEIFKVIEEEVTSEANTLLVGATADPEAFLTWLNTTFPLGVNKEDMPFNLAADKVAAAAIAKVREAYDLKVKFEDTAALIWLERSILLSAIDRLWQEHLYAMDSLRASIHLRSVGQKDPLIEYKQEAFKMFEELMGNINTEIVHNVFRRATSLAAFEQIFQNIPMRLIHEMPPGGNMPLPPGMSPEEAAMLTGTAPVTPVETDHETGPNGAPPSTENTPREPVKKEIILPIRHSGPRLGRNDACPLDPNKKFKNCCGAQGEKTCIRNVM